eukprot:m.10354 g.10354  ORF g.10354 m.10354 type:complete len:429 (+) comp2737_c0_seq1:293-1579(+)
MMPSSMRRMALGLSILIFGYCLLLPSLHSPSGLTSSMQRELDAAQRELLSPYDCDVHKHFCDLDTTRCTPSLAGGYTCECRPGFVRAGSQTQCEHAPHHDTVAADRIALTRTRRTDPEPTNAVAKADVDGKTPAAAKKEKSWVVAIPLVFQTGCKDTNLEAAQVERLNTRRKSMMEQLKRFNLDAMPAEFCRKEALEDDRPLCKDTPLSARIDNATKTLNLAKNLRNAFLTCKNSGYELCLIMEDDTVLHPNFHVEAKKTLDSIKDAGFKFGLVHLCPQMLHRTVHPEKNEPVWVPPKDYDFMPVADPIFSSQRCKNLNCSCNKKGCPCEMASKYERFFWRPPDRVWQYTTDRFPCVTYFGGPQAYLLTPDEAGAIAQGVSEQLYCGRLVGPNDMELSRFGAHKNRDHYLARKPQLCYDTGGVALTSF